MIHAIMHWLSDEKEHELGHLREENRRLQRELERCTEDLRDRFAMAALTGLMADADTSVSFDEYAADAFQCADAMLAQREIKP